MTTLVEVPTYAAIEDVLATYTTPPGVSLYPRLAAALRTATDELIGELAGRDYFRHPADPSDDPLTWSPAPIQIDGNLLHCHEGIVSLASLTIDGTELTVDTDFALYGDGPYDPVGFFEPAFHIWLASDIFPANPSLTVLSGVRGWPAIPNALAEACAQRARQLAYGDGTFSGVQELGYAGDSSVDRWPQVLYRFLKREHDRFAACNFPNDPGR